MDINTNTEHREGPVATMIESQTAKIPSDVSMVRTWGNNCFTGIEDSGQTHEALFVGQ